MDANGLRPVALDSTRKFPTLPAYLDEVVQRWESLRCEIRAEILKLIRSDDNLD
jgi:hypothetical protein